MELRFILDRYCFSNILCHLFAKLFLYLCWDVTLLNLYVLLKQVLHIFTKESLTFRNHIISPLLNGNNVHNQNIYFIKYMINNLGQSWMLQWKAWWLLALVLWSGTENFDWKHFHWIGNLWREWGQVTLFFDWR